MVSKSFPHLLRLFPVSILVLVVLAVEAVPAEAQGTRRLRQPALSQELVAFTYGSDIWVADREGGLARRITSTPAVADPEPSRRPGGR